MSAWSLDPDSAASLNQAFRLLQRITFEVCERSDTERHQIEFLAGLLLDAAPWQVVATLGDFLDGNLGRELYADDFRKALHDAGFRFRNLAGDPSLAAAIEHVQRSFDSAIGPYLIAGVPMQRPEMAELVGKISGDQPPRLVFVHGQAGSGKSVAVHQLSKNLRDLAIPCLPIQLHTHRPEASSDAFGRSKLRLPASPAISLRAVAGQRRAVLMLDQLDALRWTSAHSYETWRAATAIIEEALSDNLTTVVIACRTFGQCFPGP